MESVFQYRGGVLHAEDVPVPAIAEAAGTPVYVYSDAAITERFRAFDSAIADVPHLTCFAVKANSTRAVLHRIASLDGGADVVSGGELWRALQAGVPADRIVYSGVGKTAPEIDAALRADIRMLNAESPAELDVIAERAAREGKRAPVALRVNPDVDPRTHPYIATGLSESKFGIPIAEAEAEYARAAASPHLRVAGIACHIGSQLTSVEPFLAAIEKLLELRDRLEARGIGIETLDIGGGLGIRYADEQPPAVADYGHAVTETVKGTGLRLILEPGRAIVGNAGLLVTRGQYRKRSGAKEFVVVDAAMNDLMRPSLYGAFHGVLPVAEPETGTPEITADIVGPICESGDFLAKARAMPDCARGDLLAFTSAGAYAFSMAGHYNSRPKVAEVMVRGAQWATVRERESVEDLVRGESVPAWGE